VTDGTNGQTRIAISTSLISTAVHMRDKNARQARLVFTFRGAMVKIVIMG